MRFAFVYRCWADDCREEMTREEYLGGACVCCGMDLSQDPLTVSGRRPSSPRFQQIPSADPKVRKEARRIIDLYRHWTVDRTGDL